ncbi:hypothetical protein [Saccharothrix sp. HUAS TT1]|uniref:hypothetical protein n=1 Tax=unclassified Saccharothrix TaxID=2593673 RepID=UPI00345BBB60
MAWQDDLRELDSALATGQISADDYRRRRDEVLSAAQSASAEPDNRGPFPPPFSWDATPNQGRQPGADATQVVPGGARPVDAERTQHIRPVPPPDADRTQVVPPGQQQAGPGSGGFPAQQFPQPNWSTGSGDAAPPWGGGGTDVWGGAQGPEVFDDKPSGSGRKIALIAVVVLLVAGLGVGAYFIWGRGGSDPNAGGGTPTSSTPTTTTTVKPKTVPDGPFVEVKGSVRQFKTLTIEEALAAKVPTLEEAQLLESVGVKDVRFAVSTDDATSLSQGIWAFNADSPAAATTALEQVDALYQAASFQLLPDSPTGVQARHLPLTSVNTMATYRAHYLSDGFVVRVEAYSPDEPTAKAAFDALLTRQLEEFPPTT